MDDLKRVAADEAARRVRSGQRIGLGTGSTAAMFVEALARRLRHGEIDDVAGVPTSRRTEALARSLDVPLTTLEEQPTLDLAVDGADEVDPGLNLIKGLGGALLWEKIVAMASRSFIVVVDEGKLVPCLGHRAPVPVEVPRFGCRPASEAISALGASDVRLRKQGDSPYVTDEGNYIIDCSFGLIDDPAGLASDLDSIPAVVGHGLFVDMAAIVIVGTSHGIEVSTR